MLETNNKAVGNHRARYGELFREMLFVFDRGFLSLSLLKQSANFRTIVPEFRRISTSKGKLGERTWTRSCLASFYTSKIKREREQMRLRSLSPRIYVSSVIITRAANYARARFMQIFYADRLIKGFRCSFLCFKGLSVVYHFFFSPRSKKKERERESARRIPQRATGSRRVRRAKILNTFLSDSQ